MHSKGSALLSGACYGKYLCSGTDRGSACEGREGGVIAGGRARRSPIKREVQEVIRAPVHVMSGDVDRGRNREAIIWTFRNRL